MSFPSYPLNLFEGSVLVFLDSSPSKQSEFYEEGITHTKFLDTFPTSLQQFHEINYNSSRHGEVICENMNSAVDGRSTRRTAMLNLLKGKESEGNKTFKSSENEAMLTTLGAINVTFFTEQFSTRASNLSQHTLV
jgi:hypothetical protein